MSLAEEDTAFSVIDRFDSVLFVTLQHGCKESIGVVHMRQKLHIALKAFKLTGFKVNALLLEHFLHRNKAPTWVLGQKRLYNILIFALEQRAGRVDQSSAFFQCH